MQEEISLWEWLKAHDVLEWLKPLWDGGGWYFNDDGKLEINKQAIAIHTPWVHHGHTGWARCMLWSRVMFYAASMQMPKCFADGEMFVPSGCQNCYKVVVRPKTVTQLFELDKLEEEMGRASKCGIEVRDSVHGLYGGYFYNLGLDAGLECYKAIREAVDQRLGKDVAVILKRGCTEMEHAVGPSDKWEITDEQKEVERLITDWIVEPEKNEGNQPEAVIWHVKRKWIEYAFKHGDVTYKELTNDKSIVPGYVTYHGGE